MGSIWRTHVVHDDRCVRFRLLPSLSFPSSLSPFFHPAVQRAPAPRCPDSLCRTPRILFPVAPLPSVSPPARALSSALTALLSGPPPVYSPGVVFVDPSLASPPAPRPASPPVGCVLLFGVATPHRPSFPVTATMPVYLTHTWAHARIGMPPYPFSPTIPGLRTLAAIALVPSSNPRSSSAFYPLRSASYYARGCRWNTNRG